MKTILYVFTILATLNVAQAQTASDVASLEKIVNATVPHGDYLGRPLNVAVRRPLHLMNATALEAGTVEVANFFHDGKFFVARIPISKLEKVYLMTAPFSPVASHTFLRFAFAPGARVELVSTIETTGPAGQRKVHFSVLRNKIALKDLAVSIDGAEPEGEGAWNFKEAIAGRYTLAYRMVSLKERMTWFVMEGTPIEQTELTLTAEEGRAALRLAIKTSDEQGFSKPYNLFDANCTNLALNLIRDAAPLSRWRRAYDKWNPYTSGLTWFTSTRLEIMGWSKGSYVNLELDPEFRSEMTDVLNCYRRHVAAHIADATQTLAYLGLDQNEALLRNPLKFKSALKDYVGKNGEPNCAAP